MAAPYQAPDPTTGAWTIPAFTGTDATGAATYAFNSPINAASSANAGAGLLGNLAQGAGITAFLNILGTTLGGFMRDVPWGTQADADAKIAEWLKNNPLMPDGSSRERSAVAAPSAPGYVQDEQGYYRNTNDPTDQGYYVISGNTPIKVTPPLVPVPKPTAGAAATGGSSSSGGASSGGSGGPNQPTFGAEKGDMNAPVDMDGGFVDLGIDPDLVGGDLGGLEGGGDSAWPRNADGSFKTDNLPDGWLYPNEQMPQDGKVVKVHTNPDGSQVTIYDNGAEVWNKIPTQGSGPDVLPGTVLQDDSWKRIMDDWFVRFPTKTKEEAIAAGQAVGVPDQILNETIADRYPDATDTTGGEGTGGTGGNGSGGFGSGSGSSNGSGGTPTTPTTPTVPTQPPVQPSDGSGGGTGGGTGTGTGGTGTGTGTNGFAGMLSDSPMMDETFKEELWSMKTPQAKVLDSLLTYGYNPGMFFR